MTESKVPKNSRPTDIAIIGLSVWYPGAVSLTEFWENILAKRQQFRQMPDCRLPLKDYHHQDKNVPDKTYGQEAAVIDGFDYDWKARRIPKKTFESTDIVHWLALEVALKAIDDAQLDLKKLQEIQTGVVLGNTLTGEWTRTNAMRLRWPFVAKVMRESALHRGLTPEVVEDLVKHAEHAFKSVFPQITEDTLAGALSNTIAGRICNFLDLHGGGYTVDGACSSSLLAVLNAAQSLAGGSLDVAIAGGIDISLDTFELIGFAKTGALTSDEMRVYDKRAQGFIPGEGCGFIVMKRLADAERDGDRIYAVLKGWGLSSDGKGGLTAPSVQGQAMAIEKAYKMAGYKLKDLHFVEGHGTGTTLGDKVEISALQQALQGDKPEQKIALTSLKSIIGHTKAAAGIGAFIKATIAVNQRVIPPLAGVEDPNELFEGENAAFYPAILGKKMPEATRMRAGVSAMGFGGINTHVTLEGYGPSQEHLRSQRDEELLLNTHDQWEALVFTSPSQLGLQSLIDKAKSDVKGISRAELSDFANLKAQMVRLEDKFRAVFVVRTPREFLNLLTSCEELLNAPLKEGETREKHGQKSYMAVAYKKSAPRIGFLFPGQGSQKKEMGLSLIRRHPWALSKAREAEQFIGEEFSLLDMIEKGSSGTKLLKDTQVAQPGLSLVSAITCDYLERAGIQPKIALGHSLGELSALYASKALNFKQLMNLSYKRGKAMAADESERGSMAYLVVGKNVVLDLIDELNKSTDGYLTIANSNGPEQTVVSGDQKMVEGILALAKSKGITAGPLAVSNAFHSRYMEKGAQEFASHLQKEDFNAPTLPFVKGNCGNLFQTDDNLKSYLSTQMTSPVDFVASFKTFAEHCDLIIEVGSGSVLTGLAAKMLPKDGPTGEQKLKVLSTLATPGQDFDLKLALAVCFARGTGIRWLEVFSNRFFRPFSPAHEKSFIVSPTEKPLSFLESEAVVQPPRSSDLLQSLPVDNTEALVQRPKASEQPAKDLSPSRKVNSQIISEQTVLESIYREIAQLTGFDQSSMTPDMKLLDDLHLDSIKSTEFIGNISMQYNVASEMADLHLANAKLSELAELILQYSKNQGNPGNAPALPTPTPAPTPSPLSAADAPVPLDVKVQKKPDIPAQTTKLSSLPSSPAALIRSSAEAPESRPTHSGSSALTPTVRAKNREPWTRNFSETFTSCPLNGPHSGINWSKEKALIVVSDKSEMDNILPPAERAQSQAQFDIILTSEIKNHPLSLMSYTLVLIIMDPLSSSNLEAMDSSIKVLSELTRAKFSRFQKVVFIQSDDGKFGAVNALRLSSKAFAQSLAQERGDLTIRALSIHHQITPSFSMMKALDQELSLPQKLIVAGYDEHGHRFVPELKLDKPATYVKRLSSWSSQDVILVTGGAKGITAECAFQFAQKHRVKVVLLGSSAALKDSDNQTDHPISKILNRYLEAGLTAHYVSCDITQRDQVKATIKEAEERFGTITGIIHGAGVNHPKLLQNVDYESAMKEVKPKVRGMEHILYALNTRNLKMVVALTSVIGVVGMPGNGWYGFANENLNLKLRQFQEQNPHLWVKSLAYSVWSEIGMGARLGSDKALEDRGISAIPPSEGIARFLMLLEHEAPDLQTVITSRLGSIKLTA